MSKITNFKPDVKAASVVVARDGTGDYNCDGTADDVQIQAAIDSLSSTGGTVYIKKGTYDITKTITAYDDVVIYGDGNATLLKLANEINDELIRYISLNNVQITNLSFDGNKSNQSGTAKNMVEILECNNIIFSNNYVKNSIKDGVYFSGSNNIVCNENFAIDNTRNGIAFGSSNGRNYYVTCNDNYCENNAANAGISIEPVTYGNFKGNLLKNNPNGIANSGLSASDINRFVSIISNTIVGTGSSGTGIRSDDAYDCVISENTITQVNNGIYVDTNKNLVINNNVVSDCVNSGITLSNISGSEFIVNGNRIFNNGDYGIIGSVDNSIISNNYVCNNSLRQLNIRDGIRCNGNNLIVSGNQCIDNNTDSTATLTADAASGQVIITVDDSTSFYVNQKITIADDTPQSEEVQISSIDSSTQITLKTNLTNSYTTAQNADIIGKLSQRNGINITSGTNTTLIGNNCEGNGNAQILDGGTTTKLIGNYGIDNDQPNISTGTAAPATTPVKVGDIFVDTSTPNVYVAKGTASSADWLLVS